MMSNESEHMRVSMPFRVWLLLIALVFQVLLNGLIGWSLANTDADRRDADLKHVVGYFSLVVAVLAVACVVGTALPRRWGRPVILVTEACAVATVAIIWIGAHNPGGLHIIFLIPALAALSGTLMNDDVKDWFRFGRHHKVIGGPRTP